VEVAVFGGNGGSGCVIVRYFGPKDPTGGGILTTNISGYTVHRFSSSWDITDSGRFAVYMYGAFW
jgi:hypothetical protein